MLLVFKIKDIFEKIKGIFKKKISTQKYVEMCSLPYV